MGERLLITGGAGFLGTNIAIEAACRGYRITVMDNFVRSGSNNNAEILKRKYGVAVYHGETRQQADWNNMPEVDAIIHLAGQPGIPASISNPRLDFEVNAGGTLNALEHSRTHGKIPVL